MFQHKLMPKEVFLFSLFCFIWPHLPSTSPNLVPPPGSVYTHQSVQCFLAGALCLHMNEPEFLGFC